jgi:hypothetical protein
MAIIGSYSVTGQELITLSYAYSTVDELLSQIPDNSTNLIQASDVRDSVYTLWNQIQNVSLIAASAASASAFFQNPDPTTISVGGIPAGSTFPTQKTMQEMFDQLLYPYVAPLVTPSSLGDRQFGQNPILPVNVTWSITKKKFNITSVSFSDGYVPVFTPGSQTQIHSFNTATYSQNPGISQTNTFSISVGDGQTVVTSNATLTWKNRIYWGKIDLTSLGNPNLTTAIETGNLGIIASVGNFTTDTLIKNLSSSDGGGAGGYMYGSTLATSINGPNGNGYDGIDGDGKYLIFAWPSNFPNATSPTFTVMGLNVSSFTRVRNNSIFSNEYGFTGTRYDVWVSNTLQNSPIATLQIS